MSTVILRRDVLPETRRSLTHKFLIGTHEGYLTVGLFPDGRPGEIFLKMSKEGSTLSGLLQGFCRAFSLALQHGLSVRDAAERFRGMRFEPSGPTNNPRIPEASSILDYVARYLQLHFVPEEWVPEVGGGVPRGTIGGSASTPRGSAPPERPFASGAD
ncbi:MAG: hypothetical protein FJ253_10520 [Phycisphaerae bacterium]|nr:hypothetical protein [Phycisphaerae bacterium]